MASEEKNIRRKSCRIQTPAKKNNEFTYYPSTKYSLRRSAPVKYNSPILSESEDDIDSNCGKLKNNLFEDQIDVEGKQLYGFNTPKKHNGMAILASNTPKTPAPEFNKNSKESTTESKRRSETFTNIKTPHHIRRKIKKEINKLLPDTSSSGSDFSPDDSDFDLLEELTNEISSTSSNSEDDILKLSSISSTKRRKNNVKNLEEYVPESNEYFTSYSSNKIVTSDHTLDRLKTPRLKQDNLLRLLKNLKISKEHENHIKNIFVENEQNFSKWIFILNEGYSIICYGLGSKRKILTHFHHKMLSNQPVLVVNGYFPGLTIKDILDNISTEILDMTSNSGNLHEIVNTIELEFSLIPKKHLFIIVHNIDGTMLRNEKAQNIMSRLAKIPNIHLIASIDHINAPLVWDHDKLSDYNFSWWDVTTMLPYTEETAFENSLLIQNSGELELSSLHNVFQSLTTNAKGIYLIIINYQLANRTNSCYQGMPFKELYGKCREAFFVSSDLALRAQLTEFIDHKLVKIKRNIDGIEYLSIPIDFNLLEQFLEQSK